MLCGVAILSFASCKSTPTDTADKNKSNLVDDDAAAKKAAKDKAAKEAQIEKQNKTLLESAEAARQAAVDAGAEVQYPKLFSGVDKIYSDLKAKVAANPKADHSAEIKDVTAKFEALEKASLAKKMQEEMEKLDFDFSSVDKKAAEDGANALKKFGSLTSSTDGEELLAQANAAYDAYKMLLDKGYRAMSARERNAALAAKKDADSVKAAVAKKTKEEYTQAADKFIKADASYSRGKAYDAYEGYKFAKEKYLELYEIVKADREAAQAALEKAKQRVAEAASYSAEADTIAPLKEQVAGIEEEGATLLEKDNFANPEDAVIDVESSETAKTVEKAAEKAIAEDDAKKAGGVK